MRIWYILLKEYSIRDKWFCIIERFIYACGTEFSLKNVRWEFACVFEWCKEQISIWLEKSDFVLMKDFVMHAGKKEKKRKQKEKKEKRKKFKTFSSVFQFSPW